MVLWYFPAGNFMFKVNNKNTTTRCEICSKLTIKTVVLVCLLLTWTYFTPCSSVFIVNFEQVMPAGLESDPKCDHLCTYLYLFTCLHLRYSGVFIYNLNRFKLFWCFRFWLWTSKCWMARSRFSKFTRTKFLPAVRFIAYVQTWSEHDQKLIRNDSSVTDQ